ncbi:hypothetical protein ACQP1W_41045 [Spirillospora sp. CA-255316]
MALGHVLADRRVAMERFTTHELPETDHSAVQADLTLPRCQPAARQGRSP